MRFQTGFTITESCVRPGVEVSLQKDGELFHAMHAENLGEKEDRGKGHNIWRQKLQIKHSI
jgi:hypothetical protein